MRLKEIKPGTAIHCTSRDQIHCLVDAGIVKDSYEEFDVPIWICIKGNGMCGWMPEVHNELIKGKDYYEKNGCVCVEFSDLIVPDPELSAEEVLQIVKKLEFEFVREYLGLPYGKSLDGMLFDAEPRKIIDMCEKWKADHEKKEPEIETVDVCRIIEIQPDGRKRCVHEEGIEADPELPYGGEQLAVEQILKRYCMERDGEYIAVHEVVSRVKAV